MDHKHHTTLIRVRANLILELMPILGMSLYVQPTSQRLSSSIDLRATISVRSLAIMMNHREVP